MAVGFAAACCSLIMAATPSYAAPTEIPYDTTGKTQITGLDATLPLGPGRTDVEVDLQSGKLDAKIALPESRADFDLFGFLPTHAKVKISQASELKGTFQAGTVNVSGEFGIHITEVGHYGLGIPMPGCKTTEPVKITLASEGSFDPSKGGTLAGTYRIPKFADCGFDTEIINGLVTGKDNPITIDLTASR